MLDRTIYKTYSSYNETNRSYEFTSYYYKGIKYTRKILLNTRGFTITDEINNIPDKYKHYYILFHLHKDATWDIVNVEKKFIININVNNSKVTLLMNDLMTIIECSIVTDGVYDNMNIGYCSYTMNKLELTPTLVIKFKTHIISTNNIEVIYS